MSLREGKIEELLREAGVSFRTNSKSIVTTCPRCKKKDKLSMYRTKPFFVCYVCAGDRLTGFQGKSEYAVAELTGMSVAAVKEALYGHQYSGPVLLDVVFKDKWADDEEEDFLSISDIDEVIPGPDFFTLDQPEALKGVRYLESREIPAEVAIQYDIRYQPSSGRVIFPVKHQNKWVGWQGRYVGDLDIIDEETGLTAQRLKAVTSRNLKRSEVLMFSERVTGESAILCEGPVDALKCHLCDGGNVATMGKKVSKGQLNILRYCGIKKLYLALDPDAYKEAQQIVKEMSGEMEVYDMRPPAGYKDLGEMSMEDVRALQLSAKRVTAAYLFVGFEEKYAHRGT